jgi:hypothetical protein
MKSFALTLLAGAVACQQDDTVNSADWQSVTVSVNNTAIEGFFQDALQFGQLWADTTKSARNDVRQALADAHKNTAAKLILNFGKTVTPAVQSWAALAGQIKANPQCNQDCAVNCFDAKNSPNSLYFEPTCLNSCGCFFEITKTPQATLQAQA